MIESKFIEEIAQTVKARPEQVSAAIGLFDKGATVPFVARYRKDVTRNLDEVKLEQIQELNTQFIAITNRREAILENITSQEKMTDELREKIMACTSMTALEDLYMPFKRLRRTKASAARDQGLEPLAEIIWAQSDTNTPLLQAAEAFLNPEKGVETPEQALEGARYIVAERISQDTQARQSVRDALFEHGVVVTAATKNTEGEKTKFEAYYEFAEPLKKMPSHRLLAVLRGTRMGFLKMDLALDDDKMMAQLLQRFLTAPGTQYEAELQTIVADAYKRLLRPSMENEVLGLARQKADSEAIQVFRENARNLLLAAPAGRIPVIGVDPGLRTGCKLAVVDDTGVFQDSATIFPVEPGKDEEGAARTLLELMDKYAVNAIAIGNGTGGREVAQFIRNVLQEHNKDKAFCVFVNEAGASVYSASKVAREEFPDMDITIRGAVSIARRLQDPLAELVKIEPRSIGVGQYQHDVNQRQLKEGLHRTVESCVNRVGVDLNTASAHLLAYVSGIQSGTAQNIIAFRTEKGGFTNRTQLIEVSGIGERTLEQCAGFLRIRDGENPLDATGIHPEAYETVGRMAESLKIDLSELLSNPKVLDSIDFESFSHDEIGKFTLADIREELLKPGRDPRTKFQIPSFKEGVNSVADLEVGMELEGVVTNVTDFGAFVDVGVHQDGLVHLSELAHRFVRDPQQVVQVGNIVKVKVIGIESETQRISLTIKGTQPAPQRSRQGAQSSPSERGTGPQNRRKPTDTQRSKPRKSAGKSQRTGGKPARSGGAKEKKVTESSFNTSLADQLAALKKKSN